MPYDEKDAAKRLGARWDPGAERWYIPAGRDPEPFARWRAPAADDGFAARASPSEPAAKRTSPGQADEAVTTVLPPQAAPRRESPERDLPPTRRGAGPAKREVRVDYEPPPPPPKLDDSPVRRVVGRRVPGAAPGEHDTPAPDSLRELAFLDRINEIGPPSSIPGAEKPAAPVRRGLRDPGAARPRRTGAADADRKGMPARTSADRTCAPGWSSCTGTG